MIISVQSATKAIHFRGGSRRPDKTFPTYPFQTFRYFSGLKSNTYDPCRKTTHTILPAAALPPRAQ